MTGHRTVAPSGRPTPATFASRRSLPRRGQTVQMPSTLEPTRVLEPDQDDSVSLDHPWIVLVWNDPVNLMSYVTFVLQKLFGYSRAKAEKMMLDVHHKGRAIVSSGSQEKAELDVSRLHEHGWWATMEEGS